MDGCSRLGDFDIQIPSHEARIVDRMTVDELLSILTETEKQIIVLHFYGAMPLTEVGRTIDISYESVRKLYEEAINKMKSKAQ